MLYLLIIFTARTDFEHVFFLIFCAGMQVYFCGILKFYYHDTRMAFLSPGVNFRSSHKCTYGKPSTNVFLIFGMNFTFLWDITRHFQIKWIYRFVLSLCLVLLGLFLVFAELYFGKNSINQSVVSMAYSVFIYLVLQNMESFINIKLIWPAFYKDRFQKTNALSYLFFMFFFTNFFMFHQQYVSYFDFEMDLIKNWKLSPQHYCSTYKRRNFSNNVLITAPACNFFFGMYLGIYIRNQKSQVYQGLYTDQVLWKYVLRLVLLVFLLFPLLLIFYPGSKKPILMSTRGIIGYFFSGYFFMAYSEAWLSKFGLSPKVLNQTELNIIKS